MSDANTDRPALSPPAEGEVDWSSGSVYDQLLTLIHDRDHALRGDERTDPTEIDETVLEIMRIAIPTPVDENPVAWRYKHDGDWRYTGSPDAAISNRGEPLYATPTPAPVDWNVVGPKLVEALEKVRNTTHHSTGYSDLSARRSAFMVSDLALAAAQPGAK